ncbi:hypothetical protein LHY31_003091 [Salmonella enterica]|nr:hypothetical protein [Salmonella enterica]
MIDIEEVITKKRNSLKADRLDMSFGELMNMFEDGDFSSLLNIKGHFVGLTFNKQGLLSLFYWGYPFLRFL